MADTEITTAREQLEVLNELLESLVETVTRKQYSPEVVREILLKAFNQAGFPEVDLPIEVLHFRRILVQESDRGCVLSAAAYLESQLGSLIQSVLLEDKNVLKDTLTGTGPLATFSSRINISYLLGLIGPKAKSDLHTIRKIRNDFAHNPENIKFTDGAIADRCRSLYHDTWQTELPPREKFVRVVLGVTAVIHAAKKSAVRPQGSKDIDVSHPRFQETGKRIMSAINEQVELINPPNEPDCAGRPNSANE